MMESILQDIHICVFIEFQPAGVIFHWALFFKSTSSTWQMPFQQIPCFNDRNYSIIHQLWPPIQPNLDERVPDLKLCVDCYTVGQVNQDRRLPFKPAQSTKCCSENAIAMDGQKSSRKGPKPNVRQKRASWWFALWLHWTPSLSKWIRWLSEKVIKVCFFRPQPLQVIISFEDHFVFVVVIFFLTALCLQATVKKTHSISFPTNQKYKLVQWSNGLMATWRCFEKTKAWNPKGNVWELEYCELENVRFFSFPIPTISYQRLSSIPRALLIVEAAIFFLLATWPFTKSYKIFYPPQQSNNNNENSKLEVYLHPGKLSSQVASEILRG